MLQRPIVKIIPKLAIAAVEQIATSYAFDWIPLDGSKMAGFTLYCNQMSVNGALGNQVGLTFEVQLAPMNLTPYFSNQSPIESFFTATNPPNDSYGNDEGTVIVYNTEGAFAAVNPTSYPIGSYPTYGSLTGAFNAQNAADMIVPLICLVPLSVPSLVPAISATTGKPIGSVIPATDAEAYTVLQQNPLNTSGDGTLCQYFPQSIWGIRAILEVPAGLEAAVTDIVFSIQPRPVS